MGDIGDFWRDVKPEMKKDSERKKERNRKNALTLLDKHLVPYEVKNGGIHLVVDNHIDYYPTTGKWTCREEKRQGRGIFGLLKYIGVGNDRRKHNVCVV